MPHNFNNIKVIAFDADDTLWVNETYFRNAEKEISKLLSNYKISNKIEEEIFKKEIKNLPLYGYGIKGFILSMIEIALEISNYSVSNKVINQILDIGKNMLNKPVELLPNIEKVLNSLSGNYKLIVVTKGDLLDQERKLKKSGLLKYFDSANVISEKKPQDYLKILRDLNIRKDEFLMIGNSLKSDVLPVISIEGKAIHIPFHTTWEHEKIDKNEINTSNYLTLNNVEEILKYFN